MKRYHFLSTVLMAGLLAACSDDPQKTTTELSAISVSGNQYNLAGTYKRPCNALVGTSNRETLVIDSIVLAYYYQEWNSNTTCSGTADTTKLKTWTMSLSTSAAAITGWADNVGNPSVAPTAGDGSGPLSDTESVTLFTIKVNLSDFGDIVGTTEKAFYVVDDTATPVMLYSDVDADVVTEAVDNPYVRQ